MRPLVERPYLFKRKMCYPFITIAFFIFSFFMNMVDCSTITLFFIIISVFMLRENLQRSNAFFSFLLWFGLFLTLLSVIYVIVGTFAFPMFVFPAYGLHLSFIGLDCLAIIVIIIFAMMISLLLSHKVTPRPSEKSYAVAVLATAIILSMPITPLVASFVMTPWVETAYGNVVRSYADALSDCATDVSPQCVLELAKKYTADFFNTYKHKYPKPRQLLVNSFNIEFVKKLAAILKTGACEDYSLGLAKLIEGVYGLRTRIISFINWDHAMPEVEIDGTWYVLDLVFTTPNQIVKVSEYAEHLSKMCEERGGDYYELYEGLRRGEVRIKDPISNEDLTKQHGFD